jgi:predicted O-methyltransferase YrrM
MRLVEIEIAFSPDAIPANVAALLADAKCQIALLEEASRASIPAFVPSDFELVYRALMGVKEGNLATGRRFLEWGSGTGVVSCLAILLEFDAAGIEIEPKLVQLAEQLAAKHHIAAQFACGSFVPAGSEPRLDLAADVTWLSSGGHDGYEQLQLDPDDFDVVFAYPWPGEEQVIFDLFESSAAVGALLLTYHGQEGLRLQRKLRR